LSGVGKSTLLRHIATREVPIPAHITILFVEQEVHQLIMQNDQVTNVYQIVGDDTRAIDAVLTADVWRDHLLKQEAMLNARLAALEADGDEKRFSDAREDASARLAEVHARLSDMDAESGPARAAALLSGNLDLPSFLKSNSWSVRFGF
jgi:ATP-binding cassette, subfamily F, member 3